MRAEAIVETVRLRLRPHRTSDVSDSYAMWSNPAVTRFIGGVPSTEQQVWNRIMNYAGQWSLLGFGYWAVEARDTGAFVGEVGFANFHREIEPAMQNDPEAGWVLDPRDHGRGFATEAVAAALAWGDANLRTRRTVALIQSDNLASIRVAEKCGYAAFSRGVYLGHATTFFERTVSLSR